ncbi:MAG TPA: alkane 1-monooxygenase [Rhizomicrobium sp.]|jgi:alkane 1-monooxygenase
MSLRYSGAFAFLFSIPLLFAFAGAGAALATVIAVPLVLIGAEFLWPAREAPVSVDIGQLFRILAIFYIPCQLAVTLWAAFIVARVDTSALAFVSLALATGITMGVFGMLVAHEMIHSRDRVENTLGVLMLTGMSYRHFRIAHVHGHHRYAATPRDPATARKGESYYAFLPRTLAGQFTDAWRFEAGRCQRAGSGILANRVFRDLLVMLALYALLWAALGQRAVAFLAIESAVAIMALELFNYVAHYGLVRAPDEAFTDRHSWNASHPVGNALLFNMGRHSDHHRRAAAPYQTLQPVANTPELPAGYAGSMLMALIPPLWRRVMDRRVGELRAQPAE